MVLVQERSHEPVDGQRRTALRVVGHEDPQPLLREGRHIGQEPLGAAARAHDADILAALLVEAQAQAVPDLGLHHLVDQPGQGVGPAGEVPGQGGEEDGEQGQDTTDPMPAAVVDHRLDPSQDGEA
jgi:hypothetical protein